MKILKTYWIIIILLSIYACTSNTRYKVLSFFLDGVPNPNDTLNVANNTNEQNRSEEKNKLVQQKQASLYVLHSPYKERSCEDCHDGKGSNQLVMPEPALCYECHDDYNDEFSKLHGPVASGNCTACHNPHMSKNEKMLVTAKEDICLYCHKQQYFYSNDVHDGVELTECLDCHNPHGGEDRYILN